MFIELKDSSNIREGITMFHGVNDGQATFMQIGDERLPGIFEAGQSDDRRISAVQYVHFRFSDAQRASFVRGDAEAKLAIDHPNYKYFALIDDELREEPASDFSAGED